MTEGTKSTPDWLEIIRGTLPGGFIGMSVVLLSSRMGVEAAVSVALLVLAIWIELVELVETIKNRKPGK